MHKKMNLLINGKLVEGTNHPFPVINPATGEPACSTAPHASEQQVNQAVNAAHDAFKSWSSMSLTTRKEFLLKAFLALEPRSEQLSELLCTEQGKPLKNARSEVKSGLKAFVEAQEIDIPVKIVSENATHSFQIHRKPLGVVAAIIPWNYPVYIACIKITHALVFGNTLVLKPSPYTPLATLRIAEILSSVFPPGVLNVISGPDSKDQNCIGDQLVRHPHVALVSFTGSIPTGKRVYENCAKKLSRVLLELGGNDPAIVLKDSDIELTAKGILEGSIINNGQICCGIKRVYVHKSQIELFASRIAELAKQKLSEIGPGMIDGVTLGPLNNEMQFNRVSDLVTDAVNNGAVCLAGGKRPANLPQTGFFYEPSVLINVREGMRIVDEEQFGPVIPIMTYETEEEAILGANRSNYGLGASVWGSQPEAVNRVAQCLEAGTVWTNEHAGDSPGLPFGGFKDSGVGREGGDYDLITFTECQSVKLLKIA